MGQEIHENWHIMKNTEFTVSLSGWKKITEVKLNRNYLAILLFTCQLHESLIKLYFKQFSIFQLFSWIKVKVLISFA
jgi:hypothetical protein